MKSDDIDGLLEGKCESEEDNVPKNFNSYREFVMRAASYSISPSANYTPPGGVEKNPSQAQDEDIQEDLSIRNSEPNAEERPFLCYDAYRMPRLKGLNDLED